MVFFKTNISRLPLIVGLWSLTYHGSIIKGRAGEKSRQLSYSGFTRQKQYLPAEPS